MSYAAEPDPLCYPGSSVLINKAGLEDQSELDQFELAMFVIRASEPLPAGNLDYDHYCTIHHHLFQDVYDWAGQPRTIRIGKGGNWFCFPEHLAREMDVLFRWLADHDFLTGLDRRSFSEQAARFIAELNAGHPFREGNGRAQMTFLRLLVANAGYGFDDSVLEERRTIDAMVASFSGDLAALTELIAEIIA